MEEAICLTPILNGMEQAILLFKVQYIIDRNAKYMDSEIPIYSLEEDLPKVDAIVIAVMNQSDSIAEEIERKCGYSVISIEDVIDGSSIY